MKNDDFLCLLQISDDWTQQVGEILKIMQEKIDEEKEERKMQIKHLNGIVKNLLEQFTVSF